MCARCYHLIQNPYIKDNVVSPFWNPEALSWTQLQLGSFSLKFRLRMGNSCSIAWLPTETQRASLKVSWVSRQQQRCTCLCAEIPAKTTKVQILSALATWHCLTEQICSCARGNPFNFLTLLLILLSPRVNVEHWRHPKFPTLPCCTVMSPCRKPNALTSHKKWGQEEATTSANAPHHFRYQEFSCRSFVLG